MKDFSDNPVRTFTDAAKQVSSNGAQGFGRGIYRGCDVTMAQFHLTWLMSLRCQESSFHNVFNTGYINRLETNMKNVS